MVPHNFKCDVAIPKTPLNKIYMCYCSNIVYCYKSFYALNDPALLKTKHS